MWKESDIDNYARCLITMQGDAAGDDWWDTPWGLAAHQLVVALVHYSALGDDECKQLDDLLKRVAPYLRVRIKVKSMKTRTNGTKREKKKKNEKETAPHTPHKEKEIKKEKETKTTHTKKARVEDEWVVPDGMDALENRREAFRRVCLTFAGRYDQEQLTSFFNYWTEDDGSKMRWERQRYWNLEKRLARWVKNRYNNDDTAASMRLERAKSRQQSDADAKLAASRAAAEREAERLRRERQAEADREGHMLTGDYLSKNPDGLLARIARQRQQREQNEQKGGKA